MNNRPKYQLLPELTGQEYQALKADIAARGVQVPIELDSEGTVLDGHHRARACAELGITDYPTVTRTFDSEQDKLGHVLGLNLRRRHLGQAEKQALVHSLRDAHGWSVRAIERATGIPKSTVARYLAPVPSGTPEQAGWPFGTLEEINADRAANGVEPYTEKGFVELQAQWHEVSELLEKAAAQGAVSGRFPWDEEFLEQATEKHGAPAQRDLQQDAREAAALLDRLHETHDRLRDLASSVEDPDQFAADIGFDSAADLDEYLDSFPGGE